MEIFRTTLSLLMIFTAAAASDFSDCKLMGIYGTKNNFISVDEIPYECRTNFVTENGTEVHIINLRISPENIYLFITVTTDAPSILIFTNSDTHNQGIYVNFSSSNVKIYVSGTTSLKPYISRDSGQVHPQIHSAPDVKGNELVLWATQQFGGVSSFTTFRDPKNIYFPKLKASGTPGSSVCQLRQDVQTSADTVQSCVMDSKDELHIINIPDDIAVRNITVDVVTDDEVKAKLVLRGPVGTVWNISGMGTLSFLCNNVVQLQTVVMPPWANLSDSDTELWNKVLDYFKNTAIRSYTKIHLNNPVIQIRIRTREPIKVTEIAEVSTTESPKSFNTMQLFMSSDYKVEIHSNTKVQTNKRIYAQVRSLILGELDIFISVKSCSVHSKGIQPTEKRISFNSEPCSSCRHSSRFSFSLDMLQDLPSNTWELQCNFSLCTRTDCSNPQLVTKAVQVTPYIPPQNPCIKFSLLSVLGIAFGGFLIGVLLVGALWFIKIRTAYEGRGLKGGAGDLNKPRDDLPLEIR
ncbi:endoglin isoform X2 [Tachysurus fulvidraco]|uniref:endoglin isoform X2 n=1 Tax=Tachysurus fulvidraco TaxID=1234273 RepID=UPI001FF02E46|nr:endoglin isoform X2 [Tachysurus fulvidraco]